jgi:hypothetical protein
MATSSPTRTDAERRVQGPATALMVVAGLSIVGHLLSLMATVMATAVWVTEGVRGSHPAVEGALFRGLTIHVTSEALLIGIAAFILNAGYEMRALRNPHRVRVGLGLAMVPLLSPCVVLGIPVALWGWATMSRPTVKAAMQGLDLGPRPTTF